MWRVSGCISGALFVIGLAVLVAARGVVAPRTPDWIWRAARWIVSAAALGAAIAACSSTVMRLIGLRAEFISDPVHLLVGSLASGAMMLVVYLVVAIGLFVPSYATIIILVARFGPLLGQFETTWRGLVLLTGMLAIPAGAATAVFASATWSSTGYSGATLVALSAYIFVVVWMALLAARYVMPRLSPGVFAA